jgi:hypothetical protein
MPSRRPPSSFTSTRRGSSPPVPTAARVRFARRGAACAAGRARHRPLPWHHQEVVALNHLDALARSPRALAAVREAAGASAVRRVGALLAGRSA